MAQSIHITLRGRHNITYTGTLILSSHTNWTGLPASMINTDSLNPGPEGEQPYNSTIPEGYDMKGAGYYVIAVVLVYGMSIVMLIASHIKRRHEKIAEDKQIDKYLQDFQIVRETHDRDVYRNLKKSIMQKINWDRGRRGTIRNLHTSIIPLLAVGMAGAGNGKKEKKTSDKELIVADWRQRWRQYHSTQARSEEDVETGSEADIEMNLSHESLPAITLHLDRKVRFSGSDNCIPESPEYHRESVINNPVFTDELEDDQHEGPQIHCHKDNSHTDLQLHLSDPASSDVEVTTSDSVLYMKRNGRCYGSRERDVVWVDQVRPSSTASPDSGHATPTVDYLHPGTPSSSRAPSPCVGSNGRPLSPPVPPQYIPKRQSPASPESPGSRRDLQPSPVDLNQQQNIAKEKMLQITCL